MLCATTEFAEPDVGPAEATVWWSFLATADQSITIDTFGSDFAHDAPHLYGIPSTPLPDLRLVAENDQAGGTDQSEVTFDVVAGNWYEIRVAGWFGDQGNIMLHAASGGGSACPSGGTLIEGTGQTGDFAATCGSDDVRWAAHGATFAFSVTDPVVQFELTATAPAGFGGSTISVDVEASKANNNAALILRAQLFNFVTDSYVALARNFATHHRRSGKKLRVARRIESGRLYRAGNERSSLALANDPDFRGSPTCGPSWTRCCSIFSSRGVLPLD